MGAGRVKQQKDGGSFKVSVPYMWRVIETARSWRIAPWEIMGEERTPETVALWIRRDRILRGILE